jgi:hypothetical protein
LAKTYVASQVGVGVEGGSGHVELSGEVLDLVDQADDGLELLPGKFIKLLILCRH